MTEILRAQPPPRRRCVPPALAHHDQPDRPPSGRGLMRGAPVTSSSTVLRRPDRLYDGYVFDLDGTVYLGNALLPGAG
jgi:hypothetical protein